MSILMGWWWDVLFYVFYEIMKMFTLEIVNCYKVEILIVLLKFLNINKYITYLKQLIQ